jgi:AraC family transcriptional regulator, regulatory protein of adaptative response / methylated-DNA-[protein]-cysteine methyltransferase
LAIYRRQDDVAKSLATVMAALPTKIPQPPLALHVSGTNPVALLIPCHRVLQQSRAVGGYRWCTTRKLAIQAWERL